MHFLVLRPKIAQKVSSEEVMSLGFIFNVIFGLNLMLSNAVAFRHFKV